MLASMKKRGEDSNNNNPVPGGIEITGTFTITIKKKAKDYSTMDFSKSTIYPKEANIKIKRSVEDAINLEKEVPHYDTLLTASEVAAFLEVSENWVRDQSSFWRGKEEQMPCTRFGKYVRYDLQKVMEWLKDRAARSS